MGVVRNDPPVRCDIRWPGGVALFDNLRYRRSRGMRLDGPRLLFSPVVFCVLEAGQAAQFSGLRYIMAGGCRSLGLSSVEPEPGIAFVFGGWSHLTVRDSLFLRALKGFLRASASSNL